MGFEHGEPGQSQPVAPPMTMRMTRDFSKPRSRFCTRKLHKANGRRQSPSTRHGCRRKKLIRNGNSVSRQVNVASRSNTATQRGAEVSGDVMDAATVIGEIYIN